MNQLRQGLLPLDELDDEQFESFLLQFLGAGISLEVMETTLVAPENGNDQEAAPARRTRTIRHRLVSASKYGAPGRAGQRGIDLRALTETGLVWVFQCKHYRSSFSASHARDAVETARRDYPGADRYFLVTSGEPTPAVHDVIDPLPGWELWGCSALSARFLNADEIPGVKKIEILRRVFPVNGEAIVRRLFPLHDDLLVEPSVFFQSWLEPERLFHHRAVLVGREKALESLHDFVDESGKRILILSAPGGVGKTRLLREFGETFPEKHSGRDVLFVDPNARPSVDSTRLRAALRGELVVVQDDAHRTETLRRDLVAAVLDKGGKLVFATRPHGVESLHGWLAQVGVDSGCIRILPTLPVLRREQRLALAREILPSDKQNLAPALAELSKGCTLVTTVGAALLEREKIPLSDCLDSVDFQRAVFDRLEREIVDPLVSPDALPALRDTLRLLAVFSPWNERILDIDTISELVGILPCGIRGNIDRLLLAGLLVQTREGRRVVPDLFADHLVFHACYDSDGTLTPFARRLQDVLGAGQTGITVLRNLAETEWRARLQTGRVRGGGGDSLLAPFWSRLTETFEQADFWKRSQIIEQWTQFAVFQPERSLQLARYAINLDSAPPPPQEMRDWAGWDELCSYTQVLEKLRALLEPVAIYHAALRFRALDLLLDLYLKNKGKDERSRSEPFAAIGRVAEFRHRHSVDASLAVIAWLEGKLRDSMDVQASALRDHLLHQSTDALDLMLCPLFSRVVGNNYVSGKTFYFGDRLLSTSKTRGVRGRALALLHDLVLPHGEIAVLNALPVFGEAIAGLRSCYDGEISPKKEAEWFQEQCAALRLIEQLVASVPGQSPRVLFRIAHLLRPFSRDESSSPFGVECKRVLALVPDTHELRLARLLLSSAWEEFQPGGDVSTEGIRKVHARWEEFGDEIAAHFLREHTTPAAVVNAAESLATGYRRADFSPQFHALFSALARKRPAFAARCIDNLFTRENSPVDGWWTSWFTGCRKPPGSRRLHGWARKVLRAGNPVRWQALLSALRWTRIGEPGTKILDEIGTWAARLDDRVFEEAIACLNWGGGGERDKTIDEAILKNLDLAVLSGKNLLRLAACLRRGLGVVPRKLPPDFARRFIDALRDLHRVNSLDDHDAEAFLGHLAELEPRHFYEMSRQRVADFLILNPFERTGKNPLPHREGIFELSGLPETDGYKELAEDLFRQWRTANAGERPVWRRLFQTAVLQVSQVGLGCLRRWLDETTREDDLEEIIRSLKFDDSRIIFDEPEFVKDVLRKTEAIAPLRIEELNFRLGNSASPRIRHYTGHELDPEYRYYREDAVKAAEIHARDPELAAFYRGIICSEDANDVRMREQAGRGSFEMD
ncbi:MAG: ATP-binding protein [Opitutaceae bacterium]|nr:ATP-binding protein [Opitutaceae bacterium]